MDEGAQAVPQSHLLDEPEVLTADDAVEEFNGAGFITAGLRSAWSSSDRFKNSSIKRVDPGLMFRHGTAIVIEARRGVTLKHDVFAERLCSTRGEHIDARKAKIEGGRDPSGQDSGIPAT